MKDRRYTKPSEHCFHSVRLISFFHSDLCLTPDLTLEAFNSSFDRFLLCRDSICALTTNMVQTCSTLTTFVPRSVLLPSYFKMKCRQATNMRNKMAKDFFLFYARAQINCCNEKLRHDRFFEFRLYSKRKEVFGTLFSATKPGT